MSIKSIDLICIFLYNKGAEMKKEMCEQLTVLKKIRKKGKVNGYDVDLAEAQAKDYLSMKTRLDNIEIDVSAIKTEQARQGGMIEAIFNRLNSPIEQERKDGIIWNEIRIALKSWKGWTLIIFFLMSVALAGEKILQLLKWIPTGA